MKFLIFLVPFLLSLLSFSQGNFSIFDKIARNEKLQYEMKNKLKSENVVEKFDIKYHRCYWEIDPAENSIKGYVHSVFQADENISNLVFNLSNCLEIDSVVYHNLKITYFHNSDSLLIDLPEVVLGNMFDSICVYYHGSPVQNMGLGSFISTTHGFENSPILWTLSEPYGASDWWPCKNSLTDKIDSVDIFVLHPSQYKTASNGLLESEIKDGSKTLTHWKHKYPIAPYLIAIAVTNYQVYSDSFSLSQGILPYENYLYPENYEYLSGQVLQLKSVMQFYDSLIGPYPFMNEKYGHAQFGWGGGMEHQTMSFMGAFDYELMAHELLHQWFGDAVTCASWSEIWLNEGFATYFTALNYERFFSDQYWLPWKKNAVNTITSLPDGSVFVYDTSSSNNIFSNRLSYFKAAYLLHELRWIVGDSAFFQAVRNYYNDIRCFYSFSTTDIFKKHLETVSGKNLDYFFNDWLYNEGYPIYSVEVLNLGDKVGVKIFQTQTHSSVDFFEMPVPLQFWKDGKDTTIVFNNTFSGQLFELDSISFPDYVVFDPEIHICSKGNSVILGVNEKGLAKCDISPNPANDIINISLPNNEQISNVKVFDMQNLPLIDEYCADLSNCKLNTSKLQNGIYTVVVNSSERKYSSKVVIMR